MKGKAMDAKTERALRRELKEAYERVEELEDYVRQGQELVPDDGDDLNDSEEDDEEE
jgi:hypothetical protein